MSVRDYLAEWPLLAEEYFSKQWELLLLQVSNGIRKYARLININVPILGVVKNSVSL
jgi:hypothetical protein